MRWHFYNMNRLNIFFYSESSHYQTLFFMQNKNRFHILQSFDKNHKIIVSHRNHENAEKFFLKYCQYVGLEKKLYRHILRKYCIYKLPASVFDYNPTINDFYLPKKITYADLFQTDDVIISVKGAFDKIDDLLKPSTDIWNNKVKTPIWKEQL